MIDKLRKAIEQEKRKLSAKNLCENFGQKEIRKLEDKFINSSLYNTEMNTMRNMIRGFEEWCLNKEI
jgi:hypothetical protein